MTNKIVLNICGFLLGLGSFVLILGFFGHVDAFADDLIFIVIKNGGNAPTRFNYNLKRGDGTTLIPTTFVDLSPNASIVLYPIDSQGSPLGYTLWWDPWKGFLEDPRDVNCRDPLTNSNFLENGTPGSPLMHLLEVNFSCWIPDQPAPPPQAPVQPARNPPTQVCGGNSTPDVTFSWGTSAGATQYRVRVWDGVDWDLASPWTAGTSYTWNDFKPSNSAYSWTVTASNGVGESGITQGNWEEIWMIDCTVPLAPANLTVSKPLCSDANYDANFNWDDVTNATSYTHRLNGVDTNVNVSSRNVSGLVPGTNYTWSVRSNNLIGSSSFASGTGFSVATCTRPDLTVVSINCPSYIEPSVSFTCDGQVRNNDGATTGSTFLYIFMRGTGESPSSWTNVSSGTHEILAGNTTGTTKTTSSISLATNGANKVRLCADQNSNNVDSGVIEEGTNPSTPATPEEQNNCTDARIYVIAKPNTPCGAVNAYGDVTGDGKVWNDDATEILKYVAGIPTTYIDSAAEIERADVDNNGVITSVDALKVLRFVEGLDTTFAACTPVDPTLPGFSVACVSNLPEVTFKWRDNADNESGFTLTVNGQTRAVAASAGTGATVSYLWKAGAPIGTLVPANNATYTWSVKVTNAYATGPAVSTSLATFTTPDCRVPTNPGSFTASASCGSGQSIVSLSWSDSSYELGYTAEIGTTSAFTTKGVKSLGADSTGWTWSLAEPVDSGDTASLAGNQTTPLDSRTYYFRIKAYNALNESAYVNSSPASIATLDCRSPVTPAVTATPGCTGGVNVTFNWTPPSNPAATGYYLEINDTNWDATYGYYYITPGSTSSVTWTVGTDLFGGPPDEPAAAASYYVRIKAFNNAGEGSYSTPLLFSTSCAAPPTNLTATPGCIGVANRENRIVFSWNRVTSGVTGYNLQVSTLSSFTTFGSKSIAQPGSGSTVSFEWNETGASNNLAGTPARPTQGTTYYWRVNSTNSGVDSAWSLPMPATIRANICIPDIDIILGAGNPPSVEQNSIVTINYVVRNNTSVAKTVNVGFWAEGPNTHPPLPSCPSTTPAATFPNAAKDKTSSISVAGESSYNIGFTFTANNVPGNYTAYAYASYDCAIAEDSSTWGNNQAQQTYNVFARTWFDSTNGDVGSRAGTISVSRPGKTVSDYLVVGQDVSGTLSRKWKLTGYSKPLFPTGSRLASVDPNVNGRVYDYFYENFGKDAERLTSNCNISSLVSGTNYCNGSFTYTNQPLPGVNAVWFIKGDLHINGNLVLAAARSLVFLVSGDVYIENTVTQADGVYVVGQILRTTGSDTNVMAASTLTVNGAIYGKDVRLLRVLNAGNDINPAERIIFQPKYYFLPTPEIGKPSVAWTEPKP